jgi:hypothetical protein
MGLIEDAEVGSSDGLTLRERLELHRQDTACRACHEAMDPLGFGLENFDAIGRHRTEEAGQTIDSTGTFNGQAFSGAVDLATLLTGDTRFERCLTEKWMTFALGRFIDQTDDDTWIRHLAGNVLDRRGTVGDLIRGLLMSEAFRSRQAVVPASP